MLQIDIGNTFLHGHLEERIVRRQLIRFMDEEKPNHVCLLRKATYELKQSSCMWFHRLKDYLLWVLKEVNPSLFIQVKKDTIGQIGQRMWSEN